MSILQHIPKGNKLPVLWEKLRMTQHYMFLIAPAIKFSRFIKLILMRTNALGMVQSHINQ